MNAGYLHIPKRFCYGLLAGTNTKIYDAPTLTINNRPQKSILKEIWLSNTDSSPRYVTLHIIPSGGSAGDSTKLVPTILMPATKLWKMRLSTVLEIGETIYGFSDSANKVAYRISGVELL